jgi:hypothetical protein
MGIDANYFLNCIFTLRNYSFLRVKSRCNLLFYCNYAQLRVNPRCYTFNFKIFFAQKLNKLRMIMPKKVE